MSEKFNYIQVDTTGFEDKLKKAWNYYKDDINTWTDNFKKIYNKYYLDSSEIIKINEKFDNKNIQKMVDLYHKRILDPINMFMFINSVNEDKRVEVVNKLLDKKDDKKYNFLGVPHYGQTPAIISEFNKADISGLVEAPDGVDILNDLASCVVKIENISDLEDNDCQDLEKKLKEVCKKYCANGIAKITSALYYLNPENFIPINKYTAELFDMPTKYDESDTENNYVKKYIELCQSIKNDENILNEKDLKLFPLVSSYAFYSKNIVAEIINDFKNSKNIILTGAPGTGKTYSIKSYLKTKLGTDYKKRTCFVQFHPSYDYSEFIEGIRPSGFSEGGLEVKLQNGVFKEFCKTAFIEPKEDFYFVIDEINRANLSLVFGEILNALEYRIKFDKNGKVINPEDFIDTQYTHIMNKLKDEKEKKLLSVHADYIGKFGIPENLYILATMNDVDKSIDSFDLALRRRFIWIEMPFDENIIRFEVSKEPEKIITKAKKLNKKVVEVLGLKSYEIGHTYFLKINNYLDDENSYKLLWDYHLEPLLKEYLRTELPEKEIEIKLQEWEKDFIK